MDGITARFLRAEAMFWTHRDHGRTKIYSIDIRLYGKTVQGFPVFESFMGVLI